MNAQVKAPADGVNQAGATIHAANFATYLIAACALSTLASGLFCIWNAVKMPLAAQEGKHAL
jgi:hypothetical protein